mgnify:CR=1 FL=1|jgi:hypothetical protein|tara:strand:- start:1406 stop:1858 length:453 start_codon:yes stop_codon:yes gene_type:complete
MKEKVEATKLEFLMTLNDNFVVQRYFNVKYYNPKSRGSMELYELIKDVAESIQQDLKEKASIYMVEYADQILMNPDILNTSKTDDDEYFNLYIKIGNETICHRVWDAKIYPPKTRYTVDVRPHLKKLLRDLTDIFSSEDLIYEYLNYKLV